MDHSLTSSATSEQRPSPSIPESEEEEENHPQQCTDAPREAGSTSLQRSEEVVSTIPRPPSSETPPPQAPPPSPAVTIKQEEASSSTEEIDIEETLIRSSRMEERSVTLKQQVSSSEPATTAETISISPMITECDELSLHLCPEDATLEAIPAPRPREEVVQSPDGVPSIGRSPSSVGGEDVTGSGSPIDPVLYSWYMDARSSELDEEDEKPPFGASTVGPPTDSVPDSVPFLPRSTSFLPPYPTSTDRNLASRDDVVNPSYFRDRYSFRERSPVRHHYNLYNPNPYEPRFAFTRTGTNLCPKAVIKGPTDEEVARGFDAAFLSSKEDGENGHRKRRPVTLSSRFSPCTTNTATTATAANENDTTTATTKISNGNANDKETPVVARRRARSPPPPPRPRTPAKRHDSPASSSYHRGGRGANSNRNYRRRQQRRRNKEAASAPPPPGVRYCDHDVHRRIVEKYSTTVCSDACSRGGVRKLDFDRNPWNLNCAIDYKTREICDRLDLEERVYNYYVRSFVFNPVTTPTLLLKYMGKFSTRKNELSLDMRIDTNRKKLKPFQDLAPLSVLQEILIVNASRFAAECYAQEM